MGVDYHCSAVVGMRIEPARLWRQRTVPGCEHALPEGARFCPECGKPACQPERVPVAGFDPDRETLGGLPLVAGTDRAFFVVAAAVAKAGPDGEPAKIALPLQSEYAGSVHQMESRVYDALEPLGLWDRREWGVWCVVRVSY